MKYYFDSLDSEFCYSLDYHIQEAKENNLTQIDLYEAKPERLEGYMFCRKMQSMGEVGYCGKGCEFYDPKNGKSGMCRHQGKFYIPGEKKSFKIH